MEKFRIAYARRCIERWELAEMDEVLKGEMTDGFREFLREKGPYLSVMQACLAGQYESRKSMAKRAADEANRIWIEYLCCN